MTRLSEKSTVYSLSDRYPYGIRGWKMKSERLAIRWVEEKASGYCCDCNRRTIHKKGPTLYKGRRMVCDECAVQNPPLGWLLVLFWVGMQESEEMVPSAAEDGVARARHILGAMKRLMSLANSIRESVRAPIRTDVTYALLQRPRRRLNGRQTSPDPVLNTD